MICFGCRLPRCRWFILIVGCTGVHDVFWLQASQVSMIYFYCRLYRCPWCIWLQASQVSMIYFGCRLPRCRWFILVTGFPGVDDLFWLQASQVSMIYFSFRLPRCRWFILVAGCTGVDDYFGCRLPRCRWCILVAGCTVVGDYFGCRLPKCRWFILVVGFPGVDGLFWLQASQVSMMNILQNESEYIMQLAALTSSLNVSQICLLTLKDSLTIHIFLKKYKNQIKVLLFCFHEINEQFWKC